MSASTEIRERIFILASSKDQADIFARRWVAEGEGRRMQDARYLHGNTDALMGHMIFSTDRIVGVEGYWLHPKADQIEHWLRRTLPKTKRPFEIESVTL